MGSATDKQQREKDRALSDIAGVLAHRLRSLIAGIEGYSDLLAYSLADREQRELALRILEGVARMDRVLTDLVLYSRPAMPAPVTLDPIGLFQEVLLGIDEDDLGRITLDSRLSAGRLLQADPHQIKQALLVLIQNALDATRTGGGVRIHLSDSEGSLRFDVWNDGSIDAPEPHITVFQPFYTTKPDNLGVGLAMARRIVEAHHGQLYLASNDADTGACFTLTLPLCTGS